MISYTQYYNFLNTCSSLTMFAKGEIFSSRLLTCYMLFTLFFTVTCISFSIMRKCWQEVPDDRLEFTGLSSITERLLTSIAGYTEFSMDLPEKENDGNDT